MSCVVLLRVSDERNRNMEWKLKCCACGVNSWLVFFRVWYLHLNNSFVMTNEIEPDDDNFVRLQYNWFWYPQQNKSAISRQNIRSLSFRRLSVTCLPAIKHLPIIFFLFYEFGNFIQIFFFASNYNANAADWNSLTASNSNYGAYLLYIQWRQYTILMFRNYTVPPTK